MGANMYTNVHNMRLQDVFNTFVHCILVDKMFIYGLHNFLDHFWKLYKAMAIGCRAKYDVIVTVMLKPFKSPCTCVKCIIGVCTLCISLK